MAEAPSAARSELAPTGTLRVGLNMSNVLLTATDAATGKPKGLAADLGTELGRRLGVPVELVPFPNPGAVADAAKSGKWDVAFIGAEPQRAKEIDFTAAYVEIEATYLVPPGSPIKAVADVDRPGIRIAISGRSAYDLYLERNLKHAQRVPGRGEEVLKSFVSDKLDAMAGLRPGLMKDQVKVPGSRILDGNFTTVQQAAGVPTGRPAGAKYLREFIEDVKASGLVARTIEKHNVKGLTVAAKAAT
jgi:polar amino acid transport system substrate-binding protein